MSKKQIDWKEGDRVRVWLTRKIDGALVSGDVEGVIDSVWSRHLIVKTAYGTYHMNRKAVHLIEEGK